MVLFFELCNGAIVYNGTKLLKKIVRPSSNTQHVLGVIVDCFRLLSSHHITKKNDHLVLAYHHDSHQIGKHRRSHKNHEYSLKGLEYFQPILLSILGDFQLWNL